MMSSTLIVQDPGIEAATPTLTAPAGSAESMRAHLVELFPQFDNGREVRVKLCW